MLDTDSNRNFGRVISSQYPQSQNNLDQGNVYTNGAKNMADAIRINSYGGQPNAYMDQTGSSMGGMSIAMRMKMNRDAMYGNPVEQHHDMG